MLPSVRLGDIDWMIAASVEARRRTARRVLRTPWGAHHDACLILASERDDASVSALRRGAFWHASPMFCHCAHAVAEVERGR